MIISRYSPPGAGLDIRSNTWKPRKCVVCRRRIAKPEAKNQKACHRKACKDELARLRTEKLKKKQKAARVAKKERSRIGDIKATKPARDRDYLNWLKLLRCIVCLAAGCDPCHVGPIRGMRQKCSDYEAVPMCRTHHDEQHRLQKTFWAKYGLDRDAIIASLNARYKAERQAAA